VRKGGVIAIDNVLWGGSVIDSERNDEDTKAIRKLNEFIANDKECHYLWFRLVMD
jgi:caffeoyl-CoA O-methyltransferase